MPTNINPSDGVLEGSSIIVGLYKTFKAVKVHKTQLSNLARQCGELLSTVREYSPHFIGTEVGTKADEIERAVEKIRAQVSGWARLGNMAAFMKQNEIENGIEECRRELAACTNRFMVASSMARQRDNQQLIDMMVVLLEEVLRESTGRHRTSEALQPSEQPSQTQVIELDGQGGVPPVASSPRSKSAADYSGRVSRVSKDPVMEGTQLVFYIGEWTSGGETTALGRLKDQSPDSQKRFKEWVEEASLGRQHPNILNFIGHATIDNVVYSINPWMENGNIREYTLRNPGVDRVRLLNEIASGVEFLHERDIVHGELCDKNILINRDGKAVVCGFELFKISNPGESRDRWLAPERITSTSVPSQTKKADIWSFGLLCLEVFTGKDPYGSLRDVHVRILLMRGTHPEHPGSAAVGLSPGMWDLMESCWQKDPAQRPSMSEIQSTIRGMLPPRDSRQPPTRNREHSVPNTRGTSVGMASPSSLSPLSRSSMPTGIPSVTQEPNPSASPLPLSGSGRQPSIDSGPLPSQSTSGTNKRRMFPFGRSVKRDSLPPGTPTSGSSSMPHGALANPLSPNRSKTKSIKEASKKVARQPSRSATLILPQSRKWDPVSPVVLRSMEKAAMDSECLLRPAIDGTVSAGNLEGLVSRVISDSGIADSARNDRFRATFLTVYQLFATSERLFDILKRRFGTMELNPVTVGFRYSILLFVESWLKKGFEDEELKCSSMIKEFVLGLVASESVSEAMETKAREIASLIDDPNYVHLRQPKSCTPLRRGPADSERPQGVMPADLAAALTVVEGVRFECITYWDYVNLTRQWSFVQRIEEFCIIHNLVIVWVQTTVLRPDFVDERMKMYEEWVRVAEACRALNNFSSASAIVVALISPMVTALPLTCESKTRQALYDLAKDLTPTDGAYQSTLEKVATKDVIPWLDLHLTTLNSSFTHSNPTVEVDGHPLIDFKQCSKIAEQINTLVQYSPRQTRNTTRPDVLEYVENSLESSNGDEATRAAKERSAKLAGEERSLFEDRKKNKLLGYSWSPPRRK